MKRLELTAEQISEVLHYEPETGIFTWLTESKKDKSRAGKVAGHTVNGYRYITIGNMDRPASRVAWIYVYGVLPDHPLRFTDSDITNCAILNLFESASRTPLSKCTDADARTRVLELLSLDEVTGIFTSRVERFGWTIGCAVGGINDGYLTIGIDGERYLMHRLVWLCINGKWPDGVVDHRDGNGINNAPKNLRDVTQTINMQNLRTARKDNKTGLLGATLRADIGRYKAVIKVDGKIKRLGYFDSAEQAHEVYLTAKRTLHAGCTI